MDLSSADTPLFGETSDEKAEYQIDEPIDLRADLSELGIEEVDKGVCEDNFTNRAILRRARLSWDPVYSTNGVPTGLIRARSKETQIERRLLSLAEKRPIMTDPKNNNSDFLTGLDLIAEEASDYLVPPWVVHSTRLYLKEQEAGGPASAKRKPLAQPHRCRQIKDDGLQDVRMMTDFVASTYVALSTRHRMTSPVLGRSWSRLRLTPSICSKT